MRRRPRRNSVLGAAGLAAAPANRLANAKRAGLAAVKTGRRVGAMSRKAPTKLAATKALAAGQAVLALVARGGVAPAPAPRVAGLDDSGADWDDGGDLAIDSTEQWNEFFDEANAADGGAGGGGPVSVAPMLPAGDPYYDLDVAAAAADAAANAAYLAYRQELVETRGGSSTRS